jgi:hypothetical protein
MIAHGFADLASCRTQRLVAPDEALLDEVIFVGRVPKAAVDRTGEGCR